LNNLFYIIKPFENHIHLKNYLLELIDEIPNSNISTTIDKISKTDWLLPKSHPRKYLDLFYDGIKPHMNMLMNYFCCKQSKICNGWFQQYYKNNNHTWHNHPYTNFTNVYFLEMPDKDMKTELLDIQSKKVIDDLEINEGDILTFPAYILHRSNTILTENRKTVIAFNSDFFDVDLKKVSNMLDK